MAESYLLLLDEEDWDVVSALRTLEQKSPSYRPLRRFLSEVTDVIQIQVAALSALELQALGCPDRNHFESLIDLAKACDEQDNGSGAFHSILATVCSLGEVIVHCKDRQWSPGNKTYVLGLGMSTLVAPALAVARDVDELCELAIPVVLVALRLSIALRLRSMRIEQSSQSWTCTVRGVNVDEMVRSLETYHENTGTFPLRKVYVSEQGQEWVSLSGPPSSLSAVLKSTHWHCEAPPKRSALSAIHAPHLSALDMDEILGTHELLPNFVITPIHDASSPDWGTFQGNSLGALLKEVSHSLSQEPVTIAGVPQDMASSLSEPGASIVIMPLGSTGRLTQIQRELEDHACNVRILESAGMQSDQPGFREGSGSIAIVGIAGRFPGSNDIEGFWKSLLAGKDFHKQVPEDRFDLAAWHQASGDDSPLPYGCFLEQPGLFDNHFFNVSPREALQMDPNQRLLLTVSYEALQRAGYGKNGSLSTESSRIATYIGQTTDDWREVSNEKGIDIYYVPGLLRSFASGRLNYHYKWEGPSYSVDSTCASSASAISLACTSLLARECDMALAGGVNSLASPAMFAGLKAGGFLSPTGPCKTFRSDADGYCRAEGVGVLVLKRFEDAILDNDNIMAVIEGHARNHSANASSITHPDAVAQSRLYQKVLQSAGLCSDQISYVEMHGTGTQAGDVMEMQAIVNSLGKGRAECNPLLVGAVKANVGHAEAAAGVISMIKAVMILKTGEIPPQPGMPLNLNPKLPLGAGARVQVADGVASLKGWGRKSEVRRLLLNNFDASGGNVCFVLREQSPTKRPRQFDGRDHCVVTVSARNEASLRQNIQRLAEHILSSPNQQLQDIAYTTTARALQERLRVAYVAKSREALVEKLQQKSLHTMLQGVPGSPPGVAFLCTGMSVQYAGMGADLYRTNSRFRKNIMDMEQMCVSQELPAWSELIADRAMCLESYTTTQIQLALVAVEVALADLWTSWGIQPSFVAGHSLGEYAALCIAGVLSVSDTLALVGFRASLMEEKLSPSSHTMLAVAASHQYVTTRLYAEGMDSCSICCINAPLSTVVAGPTEQIKQLQQSFRDEQTRATLLKVPYAFHSSQFDPILAPFAIRARAAHFNKPRVPVLSTRAARIIREGGYFDVDYLVRQTRDPVRFTDALETCMVEGLADGRTIWLEVGPDRVCLEFVKATLQASNLLATIRATESNWDTVSTSIAAMYEQHAPVQWAQYHKEYQEFLKLVELPTYQFDENNFWTPYRRKVPESVKGVSPAPLNRLSKLSTSLHYIHNEVVTEGRHSFQFSSNLADAELHAVTQGHVIDGAALCPGSVFGDMAFTAAQYVNTKMWPGRMPSIELRDMNLEHAIVVPQTTSNNTMELNASISPDAENRLQLAFAHRTESSCNVTGHCIAVFDPVDYCWQESTTPAFYVRARMSSVTAAVAEGTSHHLHKGIIYRLFNSVVDYSKAFQAIDQLFWNEQSGEAVAEIGFQNSHGSDQTQYSPYWLDMMLHLPGFMLNVNTTAVGDFAWICDGFKRMRFPSKLATHRRYKCYVRKQDDAVKGVSDSEVYLFDGEDLVGMCLGIRFKRLPRAMLPRILGQHNDGHKSDQTAAVNLSSPRPYASTQQAQHSRIPPSGIALNDAQPQPSGTAVDAKDGHDLADIVIKVVSEETGVSMQDMKPNTEFADMGVDSLLSIAVVDRVKKFTGVQLGANFFSENMTVGQAKRALKPQVLAELHHDPGAGRPRRPLTSSNSAMVESWDDMNTSIPGGSTTSPQADAGLDDLDGCETPHEGFETPEHTSNAVLVHGNPAWHQKPVFLIADGSGSATAYLKLPRFTFNPPVYALESPFLRCPQQYCYTVEETAAMYIATIRRIQTQGPYSVTGWSAGAVHAYETCRQMLEMGDAIDSLVILDMHIPRPMPLGHEVTPSFIEKIGVAAGINRIAGTMTLDAIQSIKDHLMYTIRSLSSYTPLPMSGSVRPARTTIIWARKSLSEVFGEEELEKAASAGLQSEVKGNVMQDPEMELAAWFFSKRYHFGANGWDELVGGSVVCHDVDADHFSMMTLPAVKTVGRLLEQAVAP